MHLYCVKTYICSNCQVSPMLVSFLSIVRMKEWESISDSVSIAARNGLFCFSACYLCYRYFIHWFCWHFYRPLYRLYWLSLDPGCWKKLEIKSGRLRPSGQIKIHRDFCKGFFLLLLLISLTVFLVFETHNLQIICSFFLLANYSSVCHIMKV